MMVGAVPAPQKEDNPFGNTTIIITLNYIILYLIISNFIWLHFISTYLFVLINFFLLLLLFLGGAVSTIVKDFRENHTDTTVLFTVTVVPGKRTAVFIFQHIIFHTSHYFHLIPILYNKLSPDIFTNIDLNPWNLNPWRWIGEGW